MDSVVSAVIRSFSLSFAARGAAKVPDGTREVALPIETDGGLVEAVLEAVRDFQDEFGKKVRYYQASSSEMFGRVQAVPQKQAQEFARIDAELLEDLLNAAGEAKRSAVKAFEGSSQASLISAIMTAEPLPIATLRPVTPARIDRMTCSPMMGCAAVVLVPIARMQRASPRSFDELVIAPLPKLCTSPATDGE